MNNERLLNELKIFAIENHVPIIRDKSALFLQEQIKIYQPMSILEIGTAIGYSGCLMLNANPKAKLTTIEIDNKSYQKAISTFEKAGLTNNVDVKNGDAFEFLSSFAINKQKFDFIFLDGPKGQYIKYLPLCKDILNKGGVIFADNIFLHGLVLSSQPVKHKHRSMVNNLRKYIDSITHDNELDTTIYDIEDGIALSKKL